MALVTPKQYIDTAVANAGGGSPLTTGEATLLRTMPLISGPAAVSQSAYFTYFTAQKTQTVATVTTFTGSTGWSGTTPTICRIGLYSVAADGALSTIVATPNDTAQWNASDTSFSKGLNATWSKVAGIRYAVMLLCVSTGTPPTWVMLNSPSTGNTYNTIFSKPPRLSGHLTGQADVPNPGPFTDASLVNNNRAVYVEFS